MHDIDVDIGPARMPNMPLHIASLGFSDPADAVKCARAVAARNDRWAARHAVPGVVESATEMPGYDHGLTLQGGCLPQLSPNARGASGRKTPPKPIAAGEGIAIARLHDDAAKKRIEQILCADRHFCAAVTKGHQMTFVKPARWAPDVLMSELSVRFAVFYDNALEARISLSQPAALAIASVLLRTADLMNTSGEVLARPWQMYIGSATFAACEAKLQSKPDPDRSTKCKDATNDLESLGLYDLSTALKDEANRAIDTSLYRRQPPA